MFLPLELELGLLHRGVQILSYEVIRRGSIDFIGFRSTFSGALFFGRFLVILCCVCNHLGDLLGVGSAKRQLRKPLLYLNVSGGPKWFTSLVPADATSWPRIAQVERHDVLNCRTSG